MMNRTHYSKKIELSITGYQPMLENIPLLAYERLRFYEKYIVLALNNGIVANDINDLISILSDTFNIKLSFVQEFIEKFNELGHISTKSWKKSKLFTLSSKYKIVYDKKDNKIMQASTKEDQMDFENLFYVKENSKFYNRTKVIDQFKKMENAVCSDEDIEFIEETCNNNIEQITPILEEYLDKERPNLVLKPEINSLNIDKIYKSNLITDLLLNYHYNGTKSVLKDFSVIGFLKNEFDDKFFEPIRKKYEFDTEIPKFIKFDEYYEKAAQLDDQLVELEKEIAKKENKIKISEDKLTKLNKPNAKSKNKEKTLQTIKETEQELKELNAEKDIIDKNQENILKQKEKIQKENKFVIDEKIEPVYSKYNGKTVFDVRIQRFCLDIDKILDIIKHNYSDEELATYFQGVRTTVKDLSQSVLDFLSKKKTKKLANYFEKGFSELELQRLMQPLGINPMDIKNMRSFLDLADAFAHIAENTELKNKNLGQIDEFNKKRENEKVDIILSFVKFFGSLNFTKEEKNAICKIK